MALSPSPDDGIGGCNVSCIRLLGVGFGAVDKGELFSLLYNAPALTFFPRHRARVEAIAKTAVINSPPGLGPGQGQVLSHACRDNTAQWSRLR